MPTAHNQDVRVTQRCVGCKADATNLATGCQRCGRRNSLRPIQDVPFGVPHSIHGQPLKRGYV